MTYEIRQAYTEVYQVLENLPIEYVNKIPLKILEMLKTTKLEDYKIDINKQNPVDRTKLMRQTMIILAILNYQYWCPNRKTKNDLYKIYFKNEENYQKEIQKNLDNLFKIKKDYTTQNNMIIKDNVAIVEYKTSIFTKIVKWFKKILKK